MFWYFFTDNKTWSKNHFHKKIDMFLFWCHDTFLELWSQKYHYLLMCYSSELKLPNDFVINSVLELQCYNLYSTFNHSLKQNFKVDIGHQTYSCVLRSFYRWIFRTNLAIGLFICISITFHYDKFLASVVKSFERLRSCI